MARPRRQTYTMKQYIENVKEDYISNNVSTQRNPAWKPIVDGLAVTILTDEYIPPLILAEEKSGRIVIVDGGSRTTAYLMIASGNYKIKSSVEDPIIKFKKMDKDENGKTVWSEAEFDIRNKTFEQFPKELKKKFYEYQVETVIHECEADKVTKYLRRYNVHTGMNTNEKMFIYLPRFAEKVRDIIKRPFFINYSDFTNNEKEKGVLERVISESVMCMFHFKNWNKQGKKISMYLNKNSSDAEFDKLETNIANLEKIITDKTKKLFNSKNTFIWLTLYNKFSELCFLNSKFADFMNAFIDGLKDKAVDGKLFDTIDNTGSTKDKKVIEDKLYIHETLMKEYLHIEDEVPVTREEFISQNVELPIEEVKKDIDFYEETLKELKDSTIRDGSKLLNEENHISLLAMIAYSYKNDVDLDEWIYEYAENNDTYLLNQKENFLHMKADFEKYRMEHC